MPDDASFDRHPAFWPSRPPFLEPICDHSGRHGSYLCRPSGPAYLPGPRPLRIAGRKILWRDLVEELLELLDDVLGLLDVVLELDGGLGDDFLGGVDRGAAADGEGDRVAWARVDLELAVADAEGDRGEERVLAQLGDGDLRALDLEVAEDVAEEVVRHRPRRAGSLQLHQDRGGLRMADPDRQELVALDGLQEHDRLLANHVEADAVDDHLLHEKSSERGKGQSIGVGREPPEGVRGSVRTPRRRTISRLC